MPVYDRCLHDPVQEVHAVKLAHRLVLVEGLYVGVYAQQSHVGNNREEEIALRKYLGDWSAVQSILDVTAYLQVPESVAVRRLLRRKTTQANPKPRKEILAHINTVDVPTLCQLVRGRCCFSDACAHIRRATSYFQRCSFCFLLVVAG